MGAAAVTTGSSYALLDALLGVSLVMHSHIGVSMTNCCPKFLHFVRSVCSFHFRSERFYLITLLSLFLLINT